MAAGIAAQRGRHVQVIVGTEALAGIRLDMLHPPCIRPEQDRDAGAGDQEQAQQQFRCETQETAQRHQGALATATGSQSARSVRWSMATQTRKSCRPAIWWASPRATVKWRSGASAQSALPAQAAGYSV